MPETTWSTGDNITAAKLNQIEDQIVVTCTSSTRPTGVEGRVIYETDTDKLMIYSGVTSGWRVAGGGNWVTFTPTWTNLTVNNGTTSGQYRYVPGGIRVRAQVVLGSTSSITGSVSFTVPNSETSASGLLTLGIAYFVDDSTGKNWQGTSVVGASGTSVSLYAADDNINASTPVAYGTSDAIYADITVPL